MKSPICLSLDLTDSKKALDLAKSLKEDISCIKLGPRLLLRNPPSLIAEFAEIRPVFADFKIHDISSTMIENLKSLFDLKASFASIHASCGKNTLKEIYEFEKKISQKRFFKVLAVSVLTHLDEKNQPSNWKNQSLEDQTLSLASDVFNSGLTGFVCSALYAKKIKEKYKEAFIVSPGIRLKEDDLQDQKQVMSPKEAIENGVDLMVIGRPIYESPHPLQKTKKILESLK